MFHPQSTFLFARHHWSGGPSPNSNHGDQRLVREVFHDPDFHAIDVPSDLDSVRNRLAANNPNLFSASEGCKQSIARIHVPLGKSRRAEEPFPRSIFCDIPGLQPRGIVDTVKRIIACDPKIPNTPNFHLYPYCEYMHTDNPNSRPDCIYPDLYTSDAFLEEYKNVQKLPRSQAVSWNALSLDFNSGQMLLYYLNLVNRSCGPCICFSGTNQSTSDVDRSLRRCMQATISPIFFAYDIRSLSGYCDADFLVAP